MAQMKFKADAWYLSDDWSIEDVRNVIDCRDIARDLTDEDCVRVLELVAEGFDANVGINWEVIEAALDSVISEKRGVKS